MRHGRILRLSGGGTIGSGLWPFARRMEESQAGYNGGVRSPIGIGAAIAVHMLVAGVVFLIPPEVYTPYIPTITIGRPIPIDPPPPENKAETKPKVELKQTQPDPFLPTSETEARPGDGPVIGGDVRTWGDGGSGGGTTIIDPPIQPEPVLVEPGIDPRSIAGFQPDYPAAMIRMAEEGKVVVRVTIGVDGRVIDIERLSATNEAFWLATQRHALRKWRFRPATRDGVAVTGTKTLTVHFRLQD